jgi:hypothetical protein
MPPVHRAWLMMASNSRHRHGCKVQGDSWIETEPREGNLAQACHLGSRTEGRWTGRLAMRERAAWRGTDLIVDAPGS